MTNSPNPKEKTAESRLMPFTVAGIICFGLALILGVAVWYQFGTNHRLTREKEPFGVQIGNQNAANQNNNSINSINPINAAAPTAAPTPETVKAPAGEIAVEGGEVTLGGGDTKLPLRRVALAAFAIGETEVTNTQYAEFVEETKHQSPTEWKNNKFPNGAAAEPVVGVTWSDANDYCAWLSKKIGATVRLPNEAEWELAARGNTDFIYPWGNQWNDEALENTDGKGRIRPVKSFPKGRSPSGIFDMLGNVYEWTSDVFVDEAGKPIFLEGDKTIQRVIKSGSYEVERKNATIKFRFSRPEDKASKLLGFRYVVVRN